MKPTYDSRAWIVWLLCASILTLRLRNPLYLIIILLASRLVLFTFGRKEATIRLSFWRLSLLILLFSVLFNVLMVHIGETVILKLPRQIWLVGGPLTLEAAVYGVGSALILITLLSVFLTFNALVPTSELISIVPSALSNVSIVILIAASYIPQTLEHLQRIREAQALRGHRVSGLRDWQPIVIPLLVGGLERSMNLAETMVARGYGETESEKLPLRIRLVFFSGLLLLFGGWLIAFYTAAAGWTLVFFGGLLLLAGYMDQGREVRRTKYVVNHWDAFDWLVVCISLLPLFLVFIPIGAINQDSLVYSPYPLAELPAFEPLIGLSLALLAAPAALADLRR